MGSSGSTHNGSSRKAGRRVSMATSSSTSSGCASKPKRSRTPRKPSAGSDSSKVSFGVEEKPLLTLFDPTCAAQTSEELKPRLSLPSGRRYRHKPMWVRLRTIRHWWQRRTRGWDDSETWSLDTTIAKFVLPRLTAFLRLNNGHPYGMTPEEWDKKLTEMIAAMRFFAAGDQYHIGSEKEYKRALRGVQLFAKWFPALWW